MRILPTTALNLISQWNYCVMFFGHSSRRCCVCIKVYFTRRWPLQNLIEFRRCERRFVARKQKHQRHSLSLSISIKNNKNHCVHLQLHQFSPSRRCRWLLFASFLCLVWLTANWILPTRLDGKRIRIISLLIMQFFPCSLLWSYFARLIRRRKWIGNRIRFAIRQISSNLYSNAVCWCFYGSRDSKREFNVEISRKIVLWSSF